MQPTSPPDHPTGFRGTFRSDALARALYAEAAGIARALPQAVAVPADAEDLGVLVRWAHSTGRTLIPRGSGSSMAGGAVGLGVIVDLSRTTHIGAVNRDGRSVTVGTGALRGQIDARARTVGLTFPVDPSSGAFCTVGGMIAANAAGARTLRYGATRGWVQALHCVFDDGSQAWVRRDAPLPMHVPAVARLAAALEYERQQGDLALLRHAGVRKESSGYAIADALAEGGHLVDLLVGSEGTLACFVEAELRLAEVPGATAAVLASFPSLEHATACALDARDAGATACELLDRTFLDIAATGGPTGVPVDAEAALLIEVDGDSAAAASGSAQAVAAMCLRHGAFDVATALDDAAEHRLWALRHAASPILSRLAPRLRSMQFIEDGCVPPAHFPEYVRGVRAALQRFGMTGVIFGHAGDAHAHVNPLVDCTRSGWRDDVHGVLSDVTSLVARLGGTVAGEHGDGRLRAPLLGAVWSRRAMEAFARIKQAADPTGVFNTGCKVAGTSAAPVDVIKYDPDAVPLESAARSVLDAIERDRAWDRFRLSA